MTENGMDLGDRMKQYEDTFRFSLPFRMPIIVRVDGRAFHSYTRNCKKPFDDELMDVMNQTAIALVKEITGSVLAYVQSDEISVLVKYYNKIDSQPYFGNNLQKIVSIASGIASTTFTILSPIIFNEVRPAVFDARAFVLPESEVCNYLLWRQRDTERNSIMMLARSLYSQKQLDSKNGEQLQEMIFQKGDNWDKLPSDKKRGRCVVKVKAQVPLVKDGKATDEMVTRNIWGVDRNIPIFSKDRKYIEDRMNVEEG
jgi:tRNA(His) guanylyltransferase